MQPEGAHFTSDISVNLRLCRPEGLHHESNLTGMSEFFSPAHYCHTPMVVMICSPWLDGEALRTLADRLALMPSAASSVFILTMLAHEKPYWDNEIAPILSELKERTRAYVQIRVLPLPDSVDNVAGIRADALHAKLYLLAQHHGEPYLKSEQLLQSLRPAELVEGFFGSANFTANGQHLDALQTRHKWELVAQVTNSAGRMALLEHFRTLWWSAHRIDKDHPHFHQDWLWPYPGNRHG